MLHAKYRVHFTKNGDLLIAEGNENEACHKLNKASAMLGADTEDAFT